MDRLHEMLEFATALNDKADDLSRQIDEIAGELEGYQNEAEDIVNRFEDEEDGDTAAAQERFEKISDLYDYVQHLQGRQRMR